MDLLEDLWTTCARIANNRSNRGLLSPFDNEFRLNDDLTFWFTKPEAERHQLHLKADCGTYVSDGWPSEDDDGIYFDMFDWIKKPNDKFLVKLRLYL